MWDFVAVDYKPCFHPKVLLQRELDAASALLRQAQESTRANSNQETSSHDVEVYASKFEAIDNLINLLRQADHDGCHLVFEFEPFVTSKEERRIERLRRIVARTKTFTSEVHSRKVTLPHCQVCSKSSRLHQMMSLVGLSGGETLIHGLFLHFLGLVLQSVKRMWRIGAEGEGASTPEGTKKACNEFFTSLWQMLEKLGTLVERKDWERIDSLMGFLLRPVDASSAPKGKPRPIDMPACLASSVLRSKKDAMLYESFFLHKLSSLVGPNDK